MKNKLFFTPSFIGLMILILSPIGDSHAKSGKIKKVFIKEAKKEIIYKTINYPAKIIARNSSHLKSQDNAIVEKLFVHLGQKVKKGQKLISLRKIGQGLQYNAQILTSAINGSVSDIPVQVGNQINTGDWVVSVIDPDNLFVRINVSVKDKESIKVGQTGELELEQLKKKYKIEVEGVGINTDRITGTIPVHLKVINADSSLTPGAFASSKINLDKNEVFLISDSSLYYVGKKVLIATVDEKNIVKKIEVKLGAKTGDSIQILSGLKEGDKIVTRTNGHITDGDKVEVIKK